MQRLAYYIDQVSVARKMSIHMQNWHTHLPLISGQNIWRHVFGKSNLSNKDTLV